MVFIEGLRGNVLFTGDFRLPLGCASRLSFFKEKCTTQEVISSKHAQSSQYDISTSSSNKIKSLENLYIDMTFFKPEIRYIPTREESVATLVDFIKKFVTSGEKKCFPHRDYFTDYVYMKTSARIGYEFVYQEIHRLTGFKVHVNELIYKIYDQLPAIQASLTLDPFETPVHACIYENKKRDRAKTDLMSPSCVNNPMNGTSPVKERKSYSVNCQSNEVVRPLLPCCQFDEKTQKKTFKV